MWLQLISIPWKVDYMILYNFRPTIYKVFQVSFNPLYMKLSKSGSYIRLWEVNGIVNRRIGL